MLYDVIFSTHRNYVSMNVNIIVVFMALSAEQFADIQNKTSNKDMAVELIVVCMSLTYTDEQYITL